MKQYEKGQRKVRTKSYNEVERLGTALTAEQVRALSKRAMNEESMNSKDIASLGYHTIKAMDDNLKLERVIHDLVKKLEKLGVYQ